MTHQKNVWHEVRGMNQKEMREAEEETLRRYGDILHCSRPENPDRPKASPKKRAAQFLPFAALTGFEEEIALEGRILSDRIELSEAEKEEINATLNEIQSLIREQPEVSFTSFEKEGRDKGNYRMHSGRVKKIDPLRKEMILLDKTRIAFEDLVSITICRSNTPPEGQL